MCCPHKIPEFDPAYQWLKAPRSVMDQSPCVSERGNWVNKFFFDFAEHHLDNMQDPHDYTVSITNQRANIRYTYFIDTMLIPVRSDGRGNYQDTRGAGLTDRIQWISQKISVMKSLGTTPKIFHIIESFR